MSEKIKILNETLLKDNEVRSKDEQKRHKEGKELVIKELLRVDMADIVRRQDNPFCSI